MGFLAAIPIAGGIVNGFGAMDANSDNEIAKNRMEVAARQFRDVSKPILSSLQAGYAPGGFLRRAMASQYIGEANKASANAADDARAKAWRFGGSRAGRFLGGLQRAEQTRQIGAATAQNRADLDATQQMARINAALMGYSDAFPVRIATNQNSGIAQGLNQFAAQLQSDNVL